MGKAKHLSDIVVILQNTTKANMQNMHNERLVELIHVPIYPADVLFMMICYSKWDGTSQRCQSYNN